MGTTRVALFIAAVGAVACTDGNPAGVVRKIS